MSEYDDLSISADEVQLEFISCVVKRSHARFGSDEASYLDEFYEFSQDPYLNFIFQHL